MEADQTKDKRVLVAMSGGVDSSVAVGLLRDQGWDVAGVTFKLFCYGEEGRTSKACCGLEGVRDAQSVARRLGIPHTVLDLEELFRKTVMDDFSREYGRGRTPNPCVQCNTHVKFGPLLSWARQNGYEWIATGHYVRSVRTEVGGESRVLLERASDRNKDQTYVLWGVDSEVLERTLFPLGDLDKTAARSVARELDLPVWDKEESQDICFVEGRSYVDVLKESWKPDHPFFQPGPIENTEGEVLGTHPGLAHFTVGQRRGLGLTHPTPLHVVRLDPRRNTLVVGESAALLKSGCEVEDVNLFAPTSYIEEGLVDVKIRYRHEPAPARVQFRDHGFDVEFVEPQMSIAPGQSCVIYRDDRMLGGGRIRVSSMVSVS